MSHTPPAFLQKYKKTLTLYEQAEISNYNEVYYAGQSCVAKVMAPTSGKNEGYDGDYGQYKLIPGDHLGYRYEILSTLGTGAFGQVVRARDHATNNIVAVKVINNKKNVTKQAKTEIRMLQHILEQDPNDRYGIVRMLDHFYFRNHVCIAYEVLGTNLYKYLEARGFVPMPLGAVRKIAARVLIGLAFLWKQDIIHCDLKPENILFKADGDTNVKIVDLGSACFDENEGFMYIQSRFYRAPEVVLGRRIGKAIDLWSFACILCELAVGYPLFASDDERDLMGRMLEYLGSPHATLIESSPRRSVFFDDQLAFKPPANDNGGKLGPPGSKKLSSFLGVAGDHPFLDFVVQFLRWDAEERVTPRVAMRHPWIEEEFFFKEPTPASEGAVAATKPTASSTNNGIGGSSDESTLPCNRKAMLACTAASSQTTLSAKSSNSPPIRVMPIAPSGAVALQHTPTPCPSQNKAARVSLLLEHTHFSPPKATAGEDASTSLALPTCPPPLAASSPSESQGVFKNDPMPVAPKGGRRLHTVLSSELMVVPGSGCSQQHSLRSRAESFAETPPHVPIIEALRPIRRIRRALECSALPQGWSGKVEATSPKSAEADR